MSGVYVYERRGRSPRTVIALLVSWTLLGLALIVLNIALWIAVLLFLVTLPAVRDLWADPSAGLLLDDTTLRWHSGRRSAEIPLTEISKARLDRGWDFAMRLSVVPVSGRRVRLPYECTPPVEIAEREFAARGVRTERNPFAIRPVGIGR